LSYVFLAPWVGPLADAVPKARLMAWMNGVKVLGVLALLWGLHPAAAFVIVGFGAAAYAPAKYGLITELVTGDDLVAANGWVEVSVVCAALLGTVLGGLLVSPWLLGQAGVKAASVHLARWIDLVPTTTDVLGSTPPQAGLLGVSLVLLLLAYAVAALLNLLVPDSGARYPASALHPVTLTREFFQANRTLWRDREGGLSLAVTTIFWGVGATLQFAVLRWAADVLHLPLDRAAYLQAAVAIGVVIGASVAGRCVKLADARHMLWAGVALGLLMPLIGHTSWLPAALPLLVLVGIVGGLLVVPLNALLQHRGYALLSAGRSVAVQGFNENASVLVMLGVYAALIALDLPIVALMSAFGLLVAGAILLLIWRERR
jgi:MFS family permease